MQRILVWDLPIRLFHWLLVVAVSVCLVTGEAEGAAYAAHVAAGYVALVLIGFRLVWGVIGSRHARFADFLYRPAEVGNYVRGLLRGAARRYIGHNPLGGLMAVTLILVIGLAVLTGMFGAEEGAPLWPLPAGWGVDVKALGEAHEVLGNLSIVLVGLHILGVAVDYVLTRENLVWPMVSGRKEMDEATAAHEPALVGAWRGAVMGVLVLLGGAYLFANTDFAQLAAQQQENDDNDD
ncbi:MAG: cytochrome b/b6 domain-containing protein [Pseudomonadota bacterium]